ncbi:MAG: NAD(P)H-dependent oxidoreductase [bacterium]
MESKKIAVLVGSLRKESFSRKVAKTIITLSPDTLVLEIIDLSRLQMFNQDLEESPPTEWTEFRNKLKTFDGVLFVTPEYNRSVPAVLKNAIDVGSRPSGQSIWNGKPCAVVSNSPGLLGGFGANHHLRQSFVSLNIPTMQQPEEYLGGVAKIFNEEGICTNETVLANLRFFTNSFADWVSKHTLEKR